MSSRLSSLSFLLLIVVLCASSSAQQSASSTGTVVPALVNFSGVVRDLDGKPLTEIVGVTFSLYKDSEAGGPLWMETQNIQPDKTGKYSVMLGSTTSEGLPTELFSSGEARWLGIRVEGQNEQPRVLLLSVPYALKAADAQTLGGLPASAFALAQTGAGAAKSQAGSPSSTPITPPPPTSKTVTTTGGTAQHLGMFTSATNIQNSIAQQIGTTTIDIAGKLGVNTGTPAESLDVTSGNAIVRGPANFTKVGNTATLWIGDTNHPIKAIWNSGLAIGTFKAPNALFISDVTGRVGVGTTAPVNTLDVVGNISGATLFGTGLMALPGHTGDTGVYATGGEGSTSATSSGDGGVGVYAHGGQVSQGNGMGGAGLLAEGGDGYYNDGGAFQGNCCGGDGVDAYGNAEAFGLKAFGGTAVYEFENGFAGIMSTGGPGESQDGQGIVAQGGSGSSYSAGGDGIDAFAGVPPPSSGSGSGLAGSFTGDVSVIGNLTVSGTKHFKIDHPLDPANRYLYHASVESSEVLNVYSANAVLDENGEAKVQLPEWLESVNKDFRYQLTAIGAAAPNLHIAQEIQNHSFRIAGGAAGMKVSWQVTGVRNDAWEKAHPMVVDVPKPAAERGYYLSPELFGAPPEKSIQWSRNPKLMQRMKEAQQKAQDRHGQITQNASTGRP